MRGISSNSIVLNILWKKEMEEGKKKIKKFEIKREHLCIDWNFNVVDFDIHKNDIEIPDAQIQNTIFHIHSRSRSIIIQCLTSW